MSKLRFCLYIFGPISFGYTLPFIFYNWPIKIVTVYKIYEIQTINLGMAVLACVIWFSIAIFLISYPYTLPVKKKPPAKHWTEKTRWAGFLVFSLVGCFIAIYHRIFLLPPGLDQVAYQLSLMPTVGIILGISCLQDLKTKNYRIPRKFFVYLVLGLDMLIVIAFPIIFGVIGGVAISAIAILYGMSAIGIRPLKQIVVLALFVIIVFGGLSIKSEIRVLMCGGACERVSVMEFFQERETVQLAKQENIRQGAKRTPQTHRLLRMLGPQKEDLSGSKDSNLPDTDQSLEYGEHRKEGMPSTREFVQNLEAQKVAFESGSDPNYQGIRFIPPPLENSIPHYFLGRVLQRINHLGELAYIIQTTGDSIPYAYGHTYVPLLTKWIPRLFWPGKPQETFGQYFGHRYKFIHDGDLKTAVNLPFIIESYMNWGWFGILFSAFIVGAVLRLVWELWIGGSPATGNVIMGMVVVMAMVLQESNLSLQLGGLLYSVVVFWTIEALFRKWGGEYPVLKPTKFPAP